MIAQTLRSYASALLLAAALAVSTASTVDGLKLSKVLTVTVPGEEELPVLQEELIEIEQEVLEQAENRNKVQQWLLSDEYRTVLAYMGASEVEDAKKAAGAGVESNLSQGQITTAQQQFNSFLDKVIDHEKFNLGNVDDAIYETMKTDDEFGRLLVGRAFAQKEWKRVMATFKFDAEGEARAKAETAVLAILKRKFRSGKSNSAKWFGMDGLLSKRPTRGEQIIATLNEAVREYFQKIGKSIMAREDAASSQLRQGLKYMLADTFVPQKRSFLHDVRRTLFHQWGEHA